MKIKKILILSLLSTGLLFSKVVDFKIHGHMYDIKEEHFMEMVERKINDKKIQQNFTKNIRAKVRAASIGKRTLPFGKKKTSHEVDNYQILQHDVLTPSGRLYKSKGDKVLINRPNPISICFIDGSNQIMLKNQISYFDKLIKHRYGKMASCTYMVSGKSVIDLKGEYYPRTFYPSQKVYEDRFMVKSVPTYIHIEKGKRQIYSFPMDIFKNEVKIK